MTERQQTRFPVDPFIGCDLATLPCDTGLASQWTARGPRIGNTHPGASMPFGLVSACAFTGGYPTGYSLYTHTTGNTPPRFLRERAIRGITHIHPSGNGATGHYYNFLRLTPLTAANPLAEHDALTPLLEEQAAPGYYAYIREHDRVRAEVTTSRFAASHRCTFPASSQQRSISISITQSGLDAADDDRFYTPASSCRLSIAEDGSAAGVVWFAGLPLFFALHVTSGSSRIWCNRETISATDLILEEAATGIDAGILVTTNREQIDLTLAFSFDSIDTAIAQLKRAVALGFDRVARRAGEAWNHHLSAIQVDGNDDDCRLFYSLFHHALRKPAELTGAGPLGTAEHYVDLSPLHSMRQTQLPLVMSLFPERGTKIANALINLAEYYNGHFPGAHLLADMESQQACFPDKANSQAHITLYDAFVRRLPDIDWTRAVWLMHRSLQAEDPALLRGESPHTGQILDVAHGAWCTWQIAEQIGEQAIAEACKKLASVWHMAYDTVTGLPTNGAANIWPHAFRLHPQIRQRLKLLGPPTKAISILDAFFGLGSFPNPPENRFSGLTSSYDFGAPFLYHWLNRPDRTADIITAALNQCFAPTHGGLPGNDNSGALSAWYIWNAVGLYPVSGRDRFLIGAPRFDAADLHLGTGKLEIRCTRPHPDAIYLSDATLNGHSIDNGQLRWDDIQDSRLELTLTT
jgi:putative alpha-1,2-mannosidase